MVRKFCLALFVFFMCCSLQARPLNIIIVTGSNNSVNGYRDFLRTIYLDNVNVLIDDNRFTEPLRDIEKQELRQADLVIISSDNSGGDYNADSAFWSTLEVPILSHNIAVCRSNNHDNWDWFSSGKTDPDISLSDFQVFDPNDSIFEGIDVTSGSISIFETQMDFELPDEPYTGNGSLLATDLSGLPTLVRFDGSEPNYYDGSFYDPNNTPRIYFALPQEPAVFFDNASVSAKKLLCNAVASLLPECWLIGDIDCNRIVDMTDYSILSAQWLEDIIPDNNALSADIVEDGHVNSEDLSLISDFWLEGTDANAPQPNPSEWKFIPEIQDGGLITMEAKKATDDLHGVQYSFECVNNPALSSGWQYSKNYTPDNLPTGVNLSFQTKSRDTSGRFNETNCSTIETVRTDGLFYYAADASSAVALDSERFIMSDDEHNYLQVYYWDQPESEPNQATDISPALTLDPLHPEVDIEGATWFNNRIFWIGSHGRSKNGDYWKSRYNFFATTIAPDGTVSVDGVYDNLIDDLIQYDQIHNLGLEAAIGTAGGHIRQNPIPDLAPKVNGLNIEGLCTTADGTKMFIGFRNPRPEIDGKIMALVIPLANPEQVVLHGADPNLEAPLFIDLDDLGIRSMEYSPGIGEYLIVAGSHKGGDDDPVQYLYNYDFTVQDRDKLATFSDDMTPEAIFQLPDANDINLLSDDGTRLIDTPSGPVINKELPREQRIFRTRTIKP